MQRIFLEAKFTMDYLQSLTQLNQTLAQPITFEKSDTCYPTTLNARKTSESIEITLSNFIKR